MKVVSLNVSKTIEVPWEGKMIQTGIFKKPVTKPLEIKGINVEGDDQGNRKTHGGIDRAVYAYPMEHYEYWRKQYPNKELPFGMFGENLTTKGLFEDKVYVGDIFKIGTSEIMAMQPRMPCYRLGIRFDDQQIIEKYVATDYCGIFFRIVKEGIIGPDEEITLVNKDPDSLSILEIYYLMQNKGDTETINKSLKLKHLPEVLKIRFQKLLKSEE